ncbi:MAG: DNA polymerase IV [Gammaproteobacteria bacterium]
MKPATPSRIIMHVDMDAFYASIEQRDNPELKGKPVVVGGGGPRGVVAAASYESRQFGVRSAMPGREAQRRCPDAIFVKPRLDHYREVSRDIFAIFKELTPIYEGLSLDEAFLDFSDEPDIHDGVKERALLIKRRIFERTALTASVGVGPNKLVAKIASDLNKPNGLCMLFGDAIRNTLDPMPAGTIPGIGKKTVEKLQNIKVATIRDLRTAPDAALSAVFGRYAMRIKQRAGGIDHREVVPSRGDKSISAENTFAENLKTLKEMEKELIGLADRTAERARQKNLLGSVVMIKIRMPDFTTLTRQMPLQPASSASDAIGSRARELLRDWRADYPDAAVRLLGVGISGLQEERQMGLFDSPDDPVAVDQVLDSIREKFGSDMLKRGNKLH